jgi:hypothetical protein
MANDEIARQLESLPRDEHFESHSYQMVQRWLAADIGSDAVEPVLRFMEEHPELDYGSPGPLVSFIERSFRADGTERRLYEEAVLESVQRHPTGHTVWLLNRIINVTEHPEAKSRLLDAMKKAAEHPKADTFARAEIAEFLKYQAYHAQ